MVNDAPHRRPCVCFAYARGTDGQIMRAVSAATEGSNARFWWLTSFTLRDDHVESTSRRTAARYASSRRLALFFGAPHPFLWARPKKWGGKGFYKGLPLFCPAARRPRYARRRSLLAAQSAALYIQAQCGGEDAGGDAAGVRDIDHREGGGLARAGGAGIYNGHAAGVADAGDVRVPV